MSREIPQPPHEAAARRLGVNRTDLRCMDVIGTAERMTAGELAQLSALTPGAVTTVIDRLERGGLRPPRARHGGPPAEEEHPARVRAMKARA